MCNYSRTKAAAFYAISARKKNKRGLKRKTKEFKRRKRERGNWLVTISNVTGVIDNS